MSDWQDFTPFVKPIYYHDDGRIKTLTIKLSMQNIQPNQIFTEEIMCCQISILMIYKTYNQIIYLLKGLCAASYMMT